MLSVIEPGFMTTIQDPGRLGYRRFGVPVSGPMDSYAFKAANRLVANSPDAAGLEMALKGPVLQAGDDCLVALTGTGFTMSVQPAGLGSRLTAWTCPSWMAAFIPKGSALSLESSTGLGWAYLAVSGGIEVPQVMGSRSTYLRGGFGGMLGRKLVEGDVLPTFNSSINLHDLAGRYYPQGCYPDYRDSLVVEVILGPQADYFSPDALDTFLGSEYQLSFNSDRMGYRLEGPAVAHRSWADILSDGMVFGSIQVPPSGLPIVAMSDCQTTGGYAKIATVVSADLPLLAQCPFGNGRIRFRPTTVANAQARYRAMLHSLDRIEEG